MKGLGTLISLLFLSFLVSCSKDPYEYPLPTTGDIKEIRVSSSFDWSTSKLVEVSIIGLPTTIPVYSSLIISLEDGSTIFQKHHQMSENTKIVVYVPAMADKLLLHYGSSDYTLQILDGKVDFSFIPVVEE